MNERSDITLNHNSNTADTNSCSFISVIPTLGMSSCRGRAEAFARSLSSKLRTLGSQTEGEVYVANGPEQENSSIINGTTDAPTTSSSSTTILPLLEDNDVTTTTTTTNTSKLVKGTSGGNEDQSETTTKSNASMVMSGDDVEVTRNTSDTYFDFDCELESPGSPVDECEYLQLIESTSNTPNNSISETIYDNDLQQQQQLGEKEEKAKDAQDQVKEEHKLMNGVVKIDNNEQQQEQEEEEEQQQQQVEEAKEKKDNGDVNCDDGNDQMNNFKIQQSILDELVQQQQQQQHQSPLSDNYVATIKLIENHINNDVGETNNHHHYNHLNGRHTDNEVHEAANASKFNNSTEMNNNNNNNNNNHHYINNNNNNNLIINNNHDDNVNNVISNVVELKQKIVEPVDTTTNIIKEDGEKFNKGITHSGIDTTDDEDECRPQRVRRCSSLKTGKTPPGTPGRKKIVRFADKLGLDLADIKTFLDEIPNIPKSAYEDLDFNDNEVTPIQLGPKSDKLLVPLFQQPGGLTTFLDLVRERQVSLENAAVTDHINQTINGSVRVRNLDFHKSVHIRYTLDHWRTYADLQAHYVLNSCDGFSDKFTFVIYGNSMQIGQRLEFAVRFQCKGQQFWDNNYGINYCFQCLPASNTMSNILTTTTSITSVSTTIPPLTTALSSSLESSASSPYSSSSFTNTSSLITLSAAAASINNQSSLSHLSTSYRGAAAFVASRAATTTATSYALQNNHNMLNNNNNNLNNNNVRNVMTGGHMPHKALNGIDQQHNHSNMLRLLSPTAGDAWCTSFY